MTGPEVTFTGTRTGKPAQRHGYFVNAAGLRRFATAYRAAAALLPPGEARSVATKGGVVRCYRFADERTTPDSIPLMLLSGRNASTPMWAPALPALLGLRRPVHALDGLGEAGCSTQTAPLTTPEDYASWVAEACAQLGLTRVHLVGHSLGGWTAAQVARLRPSLPASVTLLDPPATFAPLGLGFIAAGMTASLAPISRARRRRLLGWITGGEAQPPAELDELGLVSVETFRVRQPQPKRPTPSELSEIGVPRLAVVAGQSKVHDARRAMSGARQAGWSAEVWPDAGHDLHIAFPQRLAELLNRHTAQTPLAENHRHSPGHE